MSKSDKSGQKQSYPFTLKQFLLLRQIGQVEVGMSREDVLKLWGKPTYVPPWYGDDFMKVHQWNYEALVMMWTPYDDRLDSMRLYLIDGEVKLPPALQKMGYFPTEKSDSSEFIDYLKFEGLGFRKEVAEAFDPDYGYDYMIYLLLESGAKVCFTSTDDEEELRHIVVKRLPHEK